MEILSLVVGIVSIVLAIVAMISSRKAEERSLHNFERTQELLQKSYEETKSLLAEVDKKAAVIDSVVQKNQEQMMSTLTNIVNETVLPKKRNFGEELGAQFIMDIINNPDRAQSSITNLGALAEMVNKIPNKQSTSQDGKAN